jgi:hypothetical protein
MTGQLKNISGKAFGVRTTGIREPYFDLPYDVAIKALDPWHIEIDKGRCFADRQASESPANRALTDNLTAIADRAPEFEAVLLDTKKKLNRL